MSALFLVINSQSWAEQFLSSGSVRFAQHQGSCGRSTTALFIRTIRSSLFVPHSEAMIAKMGLCVLDEGAVIGTFLLNC